MLVAPRAGAWIETKKHHKKNTSDRVAPRAGAWIETISSLKKLNARKSHPVRVRGLKQELVEQWKIFYCRTPCGCVD